MQTQGQSIGHLRLTIGVLLQYFISELIRKSTGQSVHYILLIMYTIIMICYVCLCNSQSHMIHIV